jgi:hypothetical protein
MRILGIRADSDSFYWGVVEGSIAAPIPVDHDRALCPASYDEAASLAWCRDRIRHLIDAYTPSSVIVRYPEVFVPNEKKEPARRRSRIEGVVLEAAHSKGVKVFSSALATISKNLGVASAKTLLTDDTLRGLDWSGNTKASREAILVAASLLDKK